MQTLHEGKRMSLPLLLTVLSEVPPMQVDETAELTYPHQDSPLPDGCKGSWGQAMEAAQRRHRTCKGQEEQEARKPPNPHPHLPRAEKEFMGVV